MKNPQAEGTIRVLRGGGWYESSIYGHSADRGRGIPDLRTYSSDYRIDSLGFRVVIPVEAARPMIADRAAGLAEAPLSRRSVLIRGGNWFLEGEELVQSEAAFGIILFGDRNWTDYDLTLETLTVSTGEGSEGARNIFRATGRGDLFCFTLGCYEGKWVEAMYLEDARWGRDETIQELKHETGRWYRVHVRVRGPQITCWLDDEQIFDFRKELHPAGGIGLGTWNNPVRWRNLKVTDPDGRVLWEGFPELPEANLPD